jgi:hypothetical protein
MNKIEVLDNLSHMWAKVEFLKEALCAEHEAPLSERARLGLNDFFYDIQRDIEAVTREAESA